MALVRAEKIIEQALEVCEQERRLLRDRGVPGDLVLVGGSSLAGALTRGDVDLHLRVPPAEFDAAVTCLRGIHAVVHPEIWQPTLATFTVAAALPAGLAVTSLGSEHDVRFTRSWRRLAEDPALLAAYNTLKLAGDAGDEARKSAFFDRVVLQP